MVLDDYGMSFIINIGIWLVSIDCLNILIMMKSTTEYVTPGVLSQDRTSAIVEWQKCQDMEEMLWTTCHIIIKAIAKFILAAHGGHV